MRTFMASFFCLALVAASPLAAATDTPSAMSAAARPRTCLVLGGGGARGAAHVGVLKVLEREHIPIDCIVGTSMGAIVGGMYAAGYGADQIEAILEHIDWDDVLRDRTPRQDLSVRSKQEDLRRLGGVELGIHEGRIAVPQGLIQGQRLELLLRRLMLPTWRARNFDQLPIPFRAVATDIVNGEKVVFDQGELAIAIRSSMSVPGAFAPTRVDGRLLIDGGILDNVPIDEARKLGAQRLIVSKVGTPLATEEQLNSPIAITQQAMRILMKRTVEAQLASLGPDDLLISPDLGRLGAAEFNRAAEASAIGFAAADAVAPQLRRYSVDTATYARFTQHHQLPGHDAPLLAFIDVLGTQSRSGKDLERQLAPLRGKPLDLATLEHEIGEAYGDGRYQRLQWHLRERDGQTGVAIEPEPKRWGPDFLHGSLRISSDFSGVSDFQLGAEYVKNGLVSESGQARARLELGRIDGLSGQFRQTFGSGDDHAWLAQMSYRAFDLPLLAFDNANLAQFRYDLWSSVIGWRYEPDNRWQFSLDAARRRERIRLLIGDPAQWGNSRASMSDLTLGARYDTLDSSAFPQHGQRFDASYRRFLPALGAKIDANVVRLAWDGVVTRGRNSLLGGVSVSSSSDGGMVVLAAHDFLGGLGQLSGYQEDALFAPQTALARAIYYRRISNDNGLVSVPVYLGGSLEAGGRWLRRKDIGDHDLIGAGSLFIGFDTGMGPILFGYGHTTNGQGSFYLLFDSLLRERVNR
ncbi:MAG: patatin-like phospholipase family protein [Dokdonella sp.]|nr:patatin-like phospholipase family protein [Dokdonella sp.]